MMCFRVSIAGPKSSSKELIKHNIGLNPVGNQPWMPRRWLQQRWRVMLFLTGLSIFTRMKRGFYSKVPVFKGLWLEQLILFPETRYFDLLQHLMHRGTPKPKTTEQADKRIKEQQKTSQEMNRKNTRFWWYCWWKTSQTTTSWMVLKRGKSWEIYYWLAGFQPSTCIALVVIRKVDPFWRCACRSDSSHGWGGPSGTCTGVWVNSLEVLVYHIFFRSWSFQ